MANEIQFYHPATGSTSLKAVLGNTAGQRWNTASVVWASLLVADVADYDIALTESPAGSYRYVASLPAGVNTADMIDVWIYDKATALSAADLPNFIGYGQINWNGSAIVTEAGTANANADALLDRAAGVETGLTFRQAMRGVIAVLLGKTSNSQKTFRDYADTKDRITSTLDSDGDRTTITLDLT